MFPLWEAEFLLVIAFSLGITAWTTDINSLNVSLADKCMMAEDC